MNDWDDLECRVAREESRHQAGTMATRRMTRKVNQQEPKGQS
ncbi:hypothetical protein WCU81_20580 [Pectobacterium atrosepticum]|nr:hypothetical protein [Pectobacterium atrosepticum]GKV87719.1 hypothetical protein PEC301296_40300 [Pectobacterium carotovorum subsp. carotovorum]AIK15246.1 hypothetical protein GZ59_34950 [Pectobacterium atrosepticum]KMK85073.1 hypothetical protein KCQ_06066 [Pectobacterium atrosepticum ICMP 1526]MDK9444883.1 hypothetical protein [Pectobacterium atrosepticum]POW24475.1 hypothetical protein PB72LOC_04031 [Pectobacterium atrosepticum]